MARLQPYFEEFNDNIKLGEYSDNQTLRDKRDILRAKLDERLPVVFAAHGEECPEYYFRDQGSYRLRTGVKPTDGDFDIDQGLYFEVDPAVWEPVTLKERVFEALDGHTKKVELRRSCVTVYYQKGGEDEYHVDFAVYADWNGHTVLAKGKSNSAADLKFWEESNQRSLESTILDRFEQDDRAQFRRSARYLKEWKDEQFASAGNGAPLGIGLTIAVLDDFQPKFASALSMERDDAGALIDVVDAMLNRFRDTVTNEGDIERRLEVKLPVGPHNDLFARMTAKQMETFEGTLTGLREALEDAIDDADPRTACLTLRGVFGERFPVPSEEETANKAARVTVGHHQSA